MELNVNALTFDSVLTCNCFELKYVWGKGSEEIDSILLSGFSLLEMLLVELKLR